MKDKKPDWEKRIKKESEDSPLLKAKRYISGSDPYEETNIFVENTDKDKETIRKIKEGLKKPGLNAQVDAAKSTDYEGLTYKTQEEIMKEIEKKYNLHKEKLDSKYYTPLIEEFHPGFEYEIMIPEKSSWSKEVFYLNESHIRLI